MFLHLLPLLSAIAADIQPAQHTESLHSRRLAVEDGRKTSSNFFDPKPHCEKLNARLCGYAKHDLGSGEEFANWMERTQHVYTNMARMDPPAFARPPYSMVYNCAPSVLPPYYWWSELTQAARFHSHQMAVYDYLGHSTDEKNSDLFNGKTGFSARMQGFFSSDEGTNDLSENAGRGTGLYDPRFITRGWLSSPGHCANIFGKVRRYLGAGYFFSSATAAKHHWTQNYFLGPELPLAQYIVAGTHELTTGTTRFLVQVYMPQAPTKVLVVVGCAVKTMKLLMGTAKSGTYYVDVNTMSGADADGCVPYYFDVDSGAAVMPADRSYHFLTYGLNNCKRNIGKGNVRPLGWNVCSCPNGSPSTGDACTSNGAVKCASCNQGFSIRSNSQCVQNVCTCPNGTPKTGSECTVHGGVMCSKCYSDDAGNDDYVLDRDSGKCRKAVCICPHGTPASGVDCMEDDSVTCAECRPGFERSDDVNCQPSAGLKTTKCTCPFGQPQTDDIYALDGDVLLCPATDPVMCASCNSGYEIIKGKFGNNKCNADVKGNVCSCPNGNPAINEACPSNGAPKCANCRAGYSLSNGKCVKNACKCPNGVVADHTTCDMNGGEACRLCVTGFRLIDSKCVQNVCKCPNGQAYTDYNCRIHGNVACEKCDKGYELTRSNRVDICLGENEENPDDICTCPNGKADNSNACSDLKKTRVLCASCDAGYTLVKGLCTNVKVSMCNRADGVIGSTTTNKPSKQPTTSAAAKTTTAPTTKAAPTTKGHTTTDEPINQPTTGDGGGDGSTATDEPINQPTTGDGGAAAKTTTAPTTKAPPTAKGRTTTDGSGNQPTAGDGGGDDVAVGGASTNAVLWSVGAVCSVTMLFM